MRKHACVASLSPKSSESIIYKILLSFPRKKQNKNRRAFKTCGNFASLSFSDMQTLFNDWLTGSSTPTQALCVQKGEIRVVSLSITSASIGKDTTGIKPLIGRNKFRFQPLPRFSLRIEFVLFFLASRITEIKVAMSYNLLQICKENQTTDFFFTSLLQ